MTDPRFTCGNLQLRERLEEEGYQISGCFDGRNERFERFERYSV